MPVHTQGPRLAAELQEAREAIWQDSLTMLLRKLKRRAEDLSAAGKSADWKLALASALKARTTVTNRWLATTLQMGNLHEVSRKVSAWNRQPDPALSRTHAVEDVVAKRRTVWRCWRYETYNNRRCG